MKKINYYLNQAVWLFILFLITGCNSLSNATPTNPSSTLVADFTPQFTLSAPSIPTELTSTSEKTSPAAVPSNPAPVSPAAPLFQSTPVVITGSSSPVTHLTWSPDSSLLASTSGSFDSTDYTVYLWNADGTPAGQLTGHSQPVTGLAWSPDGKTLASSSLDGTVRLWKREGTLAKVLQGNAGHVFAVAWSPDGKLLATGSIVTVLNPTVQIWDMEGKIVQTLWTSFSGGKFYNLAWSPDGAYLLGGATDYKLWRSDGSLVFTLDSCANCTPAWGMAWSPDSKRWAVGNESGLVQVYSNLGQKIAILNDQASVNTLAWSPDSRILAGPKTLWLANGTLIKGLNGQPQYVNCVSWSPDGKILASGGSDGLVHLWTAAGESAGTLSGHTGEIYGIAWSPDGKFLASFSTDKKVWLWSIK